MIIKLTECRSINGVEKETFDIWVNMDNFVTMNRSIKGKDTHIKLTGAFLFVKETPEEIMKLVQPVPIRANVGVDNSNMFIDYSKTPIVVLK